MSGLCRLIGSVVVITSALTTSACADALVRVSLVDKIGALDLSKSMNMGMGMHGDMSMAGMGINVNPKSVPHGNVKFNVTNLASTFVHEVIIAPVTGENQVLTYDAAKNKVDEESLKTLGKVAEIDPNKSASLTLELKPGKYVLFCNIPGHFMAGMWAVIEVK
jgi:uncharacterized cupredoxin-like copper-binding protein